MRRDGLLRVPVALMAVPAVLAVLVMSADLVSAEDLKGKFYVGGGLGYLLTTDSIRNNAALIVAPLGRDGAPFTGDRGEEVSCETTRLDVFCDPRPDDLIARETQVEQTIALNGRVGYGLTSHFSVELSVGYFKGDLKNMDVYTSKWVPEGANPFDPCAHIQALDGTCELTFVRLHQIKEPMTAAEITEIPLELNGIVRFRKDSNFNPYLGGGVGYLHTDLEVDESIDELNERFESLHLIQTSDEFGGNFGTVFSEDGDGNAAFLNPAKVTIEDGFQWQFVGGADYFFNDRFSVHFEAKYVLAQALPWASGDDAHSVKISFQGEDQINLRGFPEDMFREDGSVKVFYKNAVAPNPFDPSGTRYDCDVDGDAKITAADLAQDYDGNGSIDQCWNPAPGVTDAPTQTVVAQGGTIRLTAFTFGFGVKFHF
jgi:opacity protein-like surface antigen